MELHHRKTSYQHSPPYTSLRLFHAKTNDSSFSPEQPFCRTKSQNRLQNEISTNSNLSNVCNHRIRYHQISKFRLHLEKHEIRTERDAYLLTEMNMVYITLSDTANSSVVVQLPTISYEEYVSMHWAPKWAGFYVLGCSKANEEEEAQIISALFNSIENKENI